MPHSAGRLVRVKQVARVVASDGVQLARHGRRAPRWAERIWIDPSRCTTAGIDIDHGRGRSGRVHRGAWRVQPIGSVAQVRMAEEHWSTGASWDDVGAIDLLLQQSEQARRRDGIESLADIRGRFRRLDRMFAVVEEEGRLRPRSELPVASFRELGGTYVHIGPGGEPVFGNGGCHRLAMARVLELPEIPAQLGAVHPDALGTWTSLRRTADG
jgi:hypothetical protein